MVAGIVFRVMEGKWGWLRIGEVLFYGLCLIALITFSFPWVVELEGHRLRTGCRYAAGRFFWRREIDLRSVEKVLRDGFGNIVLPGLTPAGRKIHLQIPPDVADLHRLLRLIVERADPEGRRRDFDAVRSLTGACEKEVAPL